MLATGAIVLLILLIFTSSTILLESMNSFLVCIFSFYPVYCAARFDWENLRNCCGFHDKSESGPWSCDKIFSEALLLTKDFTGITVSYNVQTHCSRPPPGLFISGDCSCFHCFYQPCNNERANGDSSIYQLSKHQSHGRKFLWNRKSYRQTYPDTHQWLQVPLPSTKTVVRRKMYRLHGRGDVDRTVLWSQYRAGEIILVPLKFELEQYSC